jgi:hypothetical protein
MVTIGSNNILEPEEKCKFRDSNEEQTNQNNGLITKVWGSAGWTFLHSVTYGYPIKPTDENKQHYKDFFISLGNVLPCKYCRESYKKFIVEGDSALTDDVLLNRRSLTEWFYRVHNAVNNKLGVDYGVTLEDVDNRYESFRAKCGSSLSTGCVAPLDYKAFSFKKLYLIDCPVIDYKLAKPFIVLADVRNLEKKYFELIKYAGQYDCRIEILKKSKIWPFRNKFCQEQIKYMRENGISSIEQDGPWKGTPTLDELKLLLFLCSNLNRKELLESLDVLLKNNIFNMLINDLKR